MPLPPGYYPPPPYGWHPRLQFEPAEDDEARKDDSSEPRRKRTRWYGWQTLIGVGISDIAFVLGIQANSPVFGYSGIAGHALTGPIVHLAHGDIGGSFASLGLNAALPFTGAVLASALVCSDRSDFFCESEPILIGGVLGGLASVAIDIAALSKEKVKRVPGDARLAPVDLTFVPMLAHDRMGLSLGGRF
jgi:hypothetical protein